MRVCEGHQSKAPQKQILGSGVGSSRSWSLVLAEVSPTVLCGSEFLFHFKSPQSSHFYLKRVIISGAGSQDLSHINEDISCGRKSVPALRPLHQPVVTDSPVTTVGLPFPLVSDEAISLSALDPECSKSFK